MWGRDKMPSLHGRHIWIYFPVWKFNMLIQDSLELVPEGNYQQGSIGLGQHC